MYDFLEFWEDMFGSATSKSIRMLLEYCVRLYVIEICSSLQQRNTDYGHVVSICCDNKMALVVQPWKPICITDNVYKYEVARDNLSYSESESGSYNTTSLLS